MSVIDDELMLVKQFDTFIKNYTPESPEFSDRDLFQAFRQGYFSQLSDTQAELEEANRLIITVIEDNNNIRQERDELREECERLKELVCSTTLQRNEYFTELAALRRGMEYYADPERFSDNGIAREALGMGEK